MPYLSFIAFLGVTLYATHGHYQRGFVLTLALLFPLTAALAILDGRSSGSVAGGHFTVLSSSVIALFCGLMFVNPQLLYPDNLEAWRSLRALLGLACALSALRLALAVGGTLRHPLAIRVSARQLVPDGLIAGLLLGAKILVVAASPSPAIDVHHNTTAAVRHLLEGRNPYTQTYVSIYDEVEERTYEGANTFAYWPGSLFWLAPFYALLGDIRYGLVAAEALTGLALLMLVRRVGCASKDLLTAPLLWLSFPVSLFVLEQAWVDTLLVTLCAWLGYSLVGRRWAVAAVLGGVLLATKQYGFVAVWFFLVYACRERGLKKAIQLVLIAGGVAGLLIAPLALQDWGSFYARTVKSVSEARLRLDGLSVPPFLAREFDLFVPGVVGSVLTAGLAAFLTVWLSVKAPRPAAWAAASFAVYGFSFLFIKSAFCNYYYFLAIFLPLYLVLEAHAPPTRRARAGA